jgi:hypothetical protein
VDDLRVISPSSTQSTNTSNTSVVSDDRETNHVDGTPSEIVDKNAFATDKQTKVGLKEKHPQKATVEDVIKSFEKRLSESDGPEATKTKNAFEDFLESQGISREEYERQAIAQETLQRPLNNVHPDMFLEVQTGSETLQRLLNNPMRWLEDGNPNMIPLTNDELDALFNEFSEANNILLQDLDQEQETPMRNESILPKDAVGIKQNDDGT